LEVDNIKLITLVCD